MKNNRKGANPIAGCRTPPAVPDHYRNLRYASGGARPRPGCCDRCCHPPPAPKHKFTFRSEALPSARSLLKDTHKQTPLPPSHPTSQHQPTDSVARACAVSTQLPRRRTLRLSAPSVAARLCCVLRPKQPQRAERAFGAAVTGSAETAQELLAWPLAQLLAPAGGPITVKGRVGAAYVEDCALYALPLRRKGARRERCRGCAASGGLPEGPPRCPAVRAAAAPEVGGGRWAAMAASSWGPVSRGSGRAASRYLGAAVS